MFEQAKLRDYYYQLKNILYWIDHLSRKAVWYKRYEDNAGETARQLAVSDIQLWSQTLNTSHNDSSFLNKIQHNLTIVQRYRNIVCDYWLLKKHSINFYKVYMEASNRLKKNMEIVVNSYNLSFICSRIGSQSCSCRIKKVEISCGKIFFFNLYSSFWF